MGTMRRSRIRPSAVLTLFAILTACADKDVTAPDRSPPAFAAAAVTSVDLSGYTRVAMYPLNTSVVREASAVTYDIDRGSLFVVSDESYALIEISKTGAVLGTMSLSGFSDLEGVTWIGNGRFVVAEEQRRDAYRLTWVSGGSATRSSSPGVDIGSTTGNTGIEGITYDHRTGRYITAKEMSPQEVNEHVIDFTARTATTTKLFTPALGVGDLSDLQSLSAVPTLIGTPDQDNLLILSHESRRLLEVNRAGAILSSIDLSAWTIQPEGVAIDPTGTIYIVDEMIANGNSGLIILQPGPPPPPTTPIDVLSMGFEGSLSPWTQDSQKDWFVSTQRRTAGTRSAEVDGSASKAQLISPNIDLKGRTSATIRFSWYIESELDAGEYLAFEVSTNGGSTWTERARLRGNVDGENRWHNVTIDLTGISRLRVRFRGHMSSSSEDANVDAVVVTAR